MNFEGYDDECLDQKGAVKALYVFAWVCSSRSGLSVLGAREVWMSVSLITGIGEKVSPSRLTTQREWCVCVQDVCIWVHMTMCVYVFHILICVQVWKGVSVAVKGGVGHAWGKNWFSGEGKEMRRKKKWHKVARCEKSRRKEKTGSGRRMRNRWSEGETNEWRVEVWGGVGEIELALKKERVEKKDKGKGAREVKE